MTSLQSAHPQHGRTVRPLRIAMLGTGGDLPSGDGLESAVEEIGTRLVDQGHSITVHSGAGTRTLGRVSRTALSAAHLQLVRRTDVAFVFGAGNAPLVPVLRARGTAVAVHVGGPGWSRAGSSRTGQRYRRAAEQLAIRGADAVIVDSRALQDHCADEFAIQTELIGYGTTVIRDAPADLLEPLGLVPGGFHLVVSSSTPEHRVETVVEGYHRSDARLPLVVVGSVTHAADRSDVVRRLAALDPRLVLLGEVTEQRLLDQLFTHAVSYLTGHAVGGASPALLRAMGAGTAVVAWRSELNREAAGTAGSYFSSSAELARQVEEVEQYPFRFRDIGELMQERAETLHDWDVVGEQYAALASKLARGYSTRGMSPGRRADAGATRGPHVAGARE